MCGISGAVGRLTLDAVTVAQMRGGLVDCVARMSAALKHRGPDGDGLWTSPSGAVVLAHRRLAIIDVSEAGAQPMVDRESGCAISFNGEVYNFRDLRRELQSLGESFNSTSDTEVVLKAYKHWGLTAIPRLRGIFAMAIWDPRSRSVHLVRDHMGVKPLYWAVVKDSTLGSETLLFASELRALLASGYVGRHLDPAGVASYLAQGFVIGPATIVEGVNLLPAATTLTIAPGAPHHDSNARTLQQFWSLPSSTATRSTEADLREELTRAVRLQLVSDVPLGVFLSGGIDSSAIAALASDDSGGDLHTFTIGFDETGLDESIYAARVAEALGSHHTNFTLTEQHFLEHLPHALGAIDQPTYDGINTYYVSRAAREAGMTVALAGTGGDELFGGYPTFAELPRVLRAGSYVPELLRNAASGASRAIGSAYWDLLRSAPPQTRWGKIADIAHAAHDLLGIYQVSYALFTRDTQARLASALVRAAQDGQEYGLPAETTRTWRARIEGSEIHHAISLLELSGFVGERLLRDTDAASMAVSLEVRVPLLDHVLCETVAGLDPVRRFNPPLKKQLLRDAGLHKLDPALFDRPKSGFVLPIAAWARRRLQPEMERLFADAALISRAGLQPNTVARFWRSFCAGRAGLHWSRAWSIYVLLAWCERHEMAIAQ